MVAHYDRLIPLRYHTREIVLGLEVLLQTYYLKSKQATYSEAFYNLKRSKLASNGSLKELSANLIVLSVFMESVLPYLKEKLEQKDNLAAKAIVKVSNLLRFFYLFKYLVTDVRFFKPYLHLFSILVRRQNGYESSIDLKKSLIWRLLS